MKLRLPSHLVQVLLTSFAGVLTTSATVCASVPEGYTQVIITQARDLPFQVGSTDKYAFLFEADINAGINLNIAYQYWSSRNIDCTNNLKISQLNISNPNPAIAGTGLTMEHFKNLDFTDCRNTPISCGDEGFVNLMYNENMSFFSNGDYYNGPVIRLGDRSTCNIAYNTDVTFRGNADLNSAIEASILSSINIENNGKVMFYRNGGSSPVFYECGGGAIRTFGNLSIRGNEQVNFAGNWDTFDNESQEEVRLYSVVRLRSVYVGALEDSLNDIDEELKTEVMAYYEKEFGEIPRPSVCLSTGEGQTINFYDPIYVSANSTIASFNDEYVDGNNLLQKGSGDIVFSGENAASRLSTLKSDYTHQELIDSLTSEVYVTSNLYGGRLCIKDGAIYKGNGIDVAAGSNATLRLDGGTLQQSGYDVLLNANTSLDLEGTNSITAATLKMMDGSSLIFNMGTQEGAMLNLDAFLETGEITISISGDMLEAHDLISLADKSQYDTASWTEQSITVLGTDFDHLKWFGNILTYDPDAHATHYIVLDGDTEKDCFGDDQKVAIDANGYKLTVKHPVDLVQLAIKDGVVKLEGENNNVVRITLTEDGTLQLAAGANLKVGDIVSMVANQSADVMVSHNIEITDAKMYGSKGKGTLSYIDNVNMATYGDYTIENMTITGSVIDVGEGTTLYLVNVDIKSSTHITDAPARVFAQSAHVELNGTNTWVDREITAAQDTLLYMCGDTQRSITMAAGSEIVELTSSMFDSVTLTGTDLWLDMTGMAKQLEGYDYIALDFQDFAREMAKAQVDVEKLKVNVTLDGETYKHAYAMTDHGTTTTLYFPQFRDVPEPATSTLSLLAFAALAARRRRH